jgi:hypothetical protein
VTPEAFLRAVWPDEGLYCIATPLDRRGYEHHVFEFIGEAAAYAVSMAGKKNVFFATHSLKEAKVWNPHHRKSPPSNEWVGGWSVRLQTNMLMCSTFFFDLDVGNEEKKYSTQAVAIRDLLRFLEATGLPKPMITSSGGGVHVYWLLTTPILSEEWKTWAARLRQLAEHYQLKFDPARTTDTASVLRVVGTFNRKIAQHPREVRMLAMGVRTKTETFCDMISQALAAVDITPVLDPSVEAMLGSNTTRQFDGEPPTMKSLLTVCAQAQRFAKLRGRVPEPEWRLSIGLVKHTTAGRDGCHQISSGDPRYSYAGTEDYIDRWTSGPPMCSTIADMCGKTHCHGCAFFSEHSSPIRAARMFQKAPPPIVKELLDDTLIETVIPDPPLPYKRSDKGVTMLVEGKEGKTWEKEVYPYDLYPIYRSLNNTQETTKQLWRVHLPHSEPQDFSIDASTFIDPKSLESCLANHDIYVKDIGAMRGYMSAYVQELQRRTAANAQHNHLGWNKDQTGFILPGKIISAGGGIKPATLSADAAKMQDIVARKGTLAKQVELMHFYDHPAYTPLQYFMLQSLAAPIFYMTGFHGLVVNAFGITGSSKSTALEAAGAFWGMPEKYMMNCTASGITPLAREQQRDILHNLPICLDEITDIAHEVGRTLVMGSSQMSGRVRLTRSGGQRPITTDDRSTILMSTSNRSLHAIIETDNAAGTASAVRVFEIHCQPPMVHKPFEAEDFLRELRENYGHIGEAYIRAVMRIQPQVVKRVLKLKTEFSIRYNAQGGERFWFGNLASTLVACEIANNLGLLSWDRGEVERWALTRQLPVMRMGVADDARSRSPLNTLMDFVEQNDSHIIKVHTPTSVNGDAFPVQANQGEISMHYNLDTKTLYVLKARFREYCDRRKIYAAEILRQLFLDKVVTNLATQRVLGKGTKFAKGQSLCFIVDMGHPDIAGLRAVIDSQESVDKTEQPPEAA